MQGTIVKISESGKSALLAVRSSELSYGSTLVYVPNKNFQLKQVIPIPDGLPVVPWTAKNPTTGVQETRTTKSGIPLMVFA